jgi:hypothetical protein
LAQHGAAETVMRGENLSQLRQGFFGAVLFVAADQHDMFSQARTLLSFVHDPRLIGAGRRRDGKNRDGEKKPNSEEAMAHGKTFLEVGIAKSASFEK